MRYKTNPVTRSQVEEWLQQPFAQRMPQSQFRKVLRLSYPRLRIIIDEIRASQSRQENLNKIKGIKTIMERTLGGNTGIEIREEKAEPFEKPDAMKQKVIQALYEKAAKGDHNAAFRMAQILGWIVEKKEAKIDLNVSAEQHAQIDQEAKRRIQEVSGESDGVAGLLNESAILSEEIREG